MSEVKLLTLVTGEMVITNVETEGEKVYVVSVPLTILPLPPEQANGQQNQIGFAKSLPFSNYSEEIKLNKNNVIFITSPAKQLVKTYEDFIVKFKAQEAGILTPTAQQSHEILNKKVVDFSKLNM